MNARLLVVRARMGWRRKVSSLSYQVSFEKELFFCWTLLQLRLHIVWSLQMEAIPFEIRGGRGDTGRQRCVGCLKSNISFCKRATNYRDLLQKMNCKDKESCASSPPCAHHVCACPTKDMQFHMGWLWSIGLIKLYVSFAKEPYKRDDVLQKSPMI